jgi:hypothetical protein
LRNVAITLLFSLLYVLAARADIIKSGSFQASSDGVNITLRWLTEDETNVSHFEIERRSGTAGEFMSIASVDLKGPSLYEFVDRSAFEKIASLYQYRIKIVYSNGASRIRFQVCVEHGEA